jgi:hypothetical protein
MGGFIVAKFRLDGFYDATQDLSNNLARRPSLTRNRHATISDLSPLAGFRELVAGFWTPDLATSGPEHPIVSGQYFKYSRFQEAAAGDRVRSTLRGRRNRDNGYCGLPQARWANCPTPQAMAATEDAFRRVQ